jgi:hypothetical protein
VKKVRRRARSTQVTYEFHKRKMAETIPKMGSQTKAKRMSLVRGVVAWAWEMDEDKKLVWFRICMGASLGVNFLRYVTSLCRWA